MKICIQLTSMCRRKCHNLEVTQTATDGRFLFQRRDLPDPRCEKLYEFVSSLLDIVKLKDPETVNYVGLLGSMIGVNISNPVELKALSCKLAGLKTLKELYGIIGDFVESYEDLKTFYQEEQTQVIKKGGYTNGNRVYNFILDLDEWHTTLSPGSTPAETTSLSSLTRYFKVMQVKYGSRWMSFIAHSPNQMIVVSDPVQIAKELYETKSAEDVMEVLDIPELEAGDIYNALLTGIGYFKTDMERMRMMTEGVQIVGELGLLNLAY